MTTAASIFQPVSDLQLNQLKVDWIPRGEIKPNQYNPNRMTWHDRQLLRTSLLEDGWTQPIVTLPDGVIVDGEQRWTVSSEEVTPEQIGEMIDKMQERKAAGHSISDSIIWRLTESQKRLTDAIGQGLKPTLASITGGLVPRTILDLGDDAHKMISTIRHNRARGTHQIDAMAGITADLVSLGLDLDDLEARLGMDDEEVSRFIEMSQRESETMLEQLDGFGKAWEPIGLGDYTGDSQFIQQLEQSDAAAQAQKDFEAAKHSRGLEIERRFKKAVKSREKKGEDLTQEDKDVILQKIEAEVPKIEKAAVPQLKKLLMFVTPEEYAGVIEVLGDEAIASELVRLCKWAKVAGYARENTRQKAN